MHPFRQLDNLVLYTRTTEIVRGVPVGSAEVLLLAAAPMSPAASNPLYVDAMGTVRTAHRRGA